ncbi:MAG: outer membrane lipoprotein carrier protein LolA [Rhodospirillaceae bacterium]|nr:outer membrane lipoprotein carrier protein LolA [Rhodospirillaceae bacterium]
MSAHKHPKLFTANIFINSHYAQILLALVFLGIVFFKPSFGFAKDAFGLNPAQVAQVKKAQKSLNSITTLEAKFIQATSRGSFARGKLWLSVPGRMRFDYDPPVEVLIVSDGSTVLFKDEELDQLSYTTFDSTPASMLLGGAVDFFGSKIMLTDFENTDTTINITVVREDDPAEGSLTMVFETKSMMLKKWMVIDAQGIATTVSLLDANFGARINPEFFKVEQRTMKKKAN